ncbi:hypothetical protein [Nocardia sp. NPDC004722]
MTADPNAVNRRRRLRRRHAGEGIEDGVNVIGVVLAGLGVVALALALVAGGYGLGGWAAVAAVACVVLFLASAAVIVGEWRRRRSRDKAGPAVRQGH